MAVYRKHHKTNQILRHLQIQVVLLNYTQVHTASLFTEKSFHEVETSQQFILFSFLCRCHFGDLFSSYD